MTKLEAIKTRLAALKPLKDTETRDDAVAWIKFHADAPTDIAALLKVVEAVRAVSDSQRGTDKTCIEILTAIGALHFALAELDAEEA